MHIPFCFHKCHYCDFYSIVDDRKSGDRQVLLTDRLISEICLRNEQLRLKPCTIFVGGGTPTLLRPALWQRILDQLANLGMLDAVREFTVEANPETVTPELMNVLKAGGVNRVSIGAQSFNTAHLKTLERWHDPQNVPRAIDVVRDAGIDNINLDLIFAVPGQTMDDLLADIRAAVALQPTHLSCYSLTFEPNTALTQRKNLGLIKPAPEQLERDMYDRVIDELEAAGFEQYEISAYCRSPEQRCAHNLNYWRNGNWLGVGPAAASHIDGYRWRNAPHLGKYLAATPEPPVVDFEHLPAARRAGEAIMLALRLREGIGMARLHEHLLANDARWATISQLVAAGLLTESDEHLRLTRKGLFVADAIIAELL